MSNSDTGAAKQLGQNPGNPTRMTAPSSTDRPIPEDAICHEHLIMGCTFTHKPEDSPIDSDVVNLGMVKPSAP